MTSATLAQRRGPLATPGGWTHYIPASRIDARDNPTWGRISDPERILWLTLESVWKAEPRAFPTNDELAAMTGWDVRKVRRTLGRLEANQCIHRPLTPGRVDKVSGRESVTGRLGIVALVRLSDRDVATPETLDRVDATMRRELERRRSAVPFLVTDPGIGAGQDWHRLQVKSDRSCRSNLPPPLKRRGNDGKTTTTTDAWGELPLSGDLIACIPESSSSVSIPRKPEPEKPPTHAADGSGDVPVSGSPAAAAPVDDAGMVKLVAEAAAIVPEATRQWVLLELLSACGRYGVDLALLVLAWLKVRLEHRDSERRPNDRQTWALGTARRMCQELAGGIVTFGTIEAKIRDSSRGPRAARFDPGAYLARLRAEGWALVRDGPGSVKPVKVRDSAPDWECISLRGLRELARAHREELIAHVLDGKGVPDDP
jgi:hypothetical protein